MKILRYITFGAICLTSFSTFAQKKVALVNFSVNKEIGAGDFSNSGIIVTEILKLVEDERFNLQSVFEDFYTKFHEDFAKDFPFELLPESDILNNTGYSSYRPDNEKAGYYLMKPGYQALTRPFLGIGKADTEYMVELFKNESDGILMTFLYFEFAQKSVAGVGFAQVNAIFDMICFNGEGKKVFSIIEYGKSKKKVGVVGGIPILEVDKIQPMCFSATEELMKELDKNLKKVVKKASKKL